MLSTFHSLLAHFSFLRRSTAIKARFFKVLWDRFGIFRDRFGMLDPFAGHSTAIKEEQHRKLAGPRPGIEQGDVGPPPPTWTEEEVKGHR